MVLFTSHRPLTRAENIRAALEGYDGDKQFIQIDPCRPNISALSSPAYRIRVAD